MVTKKSKPTYLKPIEQTPITQEERTITVRPNKYQTVTLRARGWCAIDNNGVIDRACPSSTNTEKGACLQNEQQIDPNLISPQDTKDYYFDPSRIRPIKSMHNPPTTARGVLLYSACMDSQIQVLPSFFSIQSSKPTPVPTPEKPFLARLLSRLSR